MVGFTDLPSGRLVLDLDFLLFDVRLKVTSLKISFITFYLQRVRIDFHAFDRIHRWHILLIILFIILLFSKHLNLE